MIFAFFSVLFGFISHIKMGNLAKKECKRTQRSFFKVKKECYVLFSIYIYIYISTYTYVYLYISIYINILKKEWSVLRSLQKNVAFFAFFSVLQKRTERSFGSHKSPKTRKKNGKERNVRNVKERSAQPSPLQAPELIVS